MPDRSMSLFSRFALTLWILIAFSLALAGQNWPSDPRLKTWIGQIGADEGWQILAEKFGGDEAAVCRFEAAGGFTPEQISWIRSCLERFDAEPALRDVVDPLRLPGGRAPTTEEELRETAQRPVVRSLGLVRTSPTSRSIDAVLRIDLDASLPERLQLFEELERARVDAASHALLLQHAGHPAVAVALDRESKRIETVFAPILTILAFLSTAVFLRSWRLAGLAVLPAIAASSAARFGLKTAGFTSDLILVSVGPLVFVLLLAAMLHLAVTFQRRLILSGSARIAAGEALREKFKVALLGALTTAVGFGVFAWSDLRSVALLGGATAISVLLFVPLGYLITAWFLSRMNFGSLSSRSGPGDLRARRRTWRRIAALSFRKRFIVRVVTLVLLLAGAWFGAHLRTETNALHYFPGDSRLKSDFIALEASGSPLSSFEILLQRDPEESAETLPKLSVAIGAIEGVAGVFGPEAVLEELRAQGGLALVRRALEGTALRTSDRLDDTGGWARWTVRFPTGEAEETKALVERVRAQAQISLEGKPYRKLYVAGSLPRLLEMQSLLIGTLGRSLVLTGLASGLLFFLFATRRPRELFATLVANVTPIAAILVAARLLNFPLDGATVMVAAVALGLAVDNTFHILHAANPARPAPRGVLPAFSKVGEAAAASSFGLTLGFAALAFSGFAPTARFGILCAVGASIGLVADLVVLPAFWMKPESD